MRAGRPSLTGALILLVGALPAAAHELGTIRTTARFQRSGRYAVELIVDREHLPPGFAARPVGDLARGTRIAFDGRPDSPRTVVRPDGAETVIVLSGRIPAGARTFTWSNPVRLGTYLLTLETEGQPEVERQWLENGKESRPFALAASIVPPTRIPVVRQYLGLGFTHILPKGTDHILFVLGIFLLSARLKPVLLQVSAFTVAHTITLALTMYGVVSIPRSVVEPLIALSIVYVAIENVARTDLTPWRVALVFAFGLLHGMGFAGVLAELGLPRSEFVPALLSFNLGVETGQLTVIGIALALFGLPFRRKPWYRSRIAVPASIAIAAVGFYWSVERVLLR